MVMCLPTTLSPSTSLFFLSSFISHSSANPPFFDIPCEIDESCLFCFVLWVSGWVVVLGDSHSPALTFSSVIPSRYHHPNHHIIFVCTKKKKNIMLCTLYLRKLHYFPCRPHSCDFSTLVRITQRTVAAADYNGVSGGASANGSPPSSHRNSPGAFYNSMSQSNRQLPVHLHGIVISALFLLGLVAARYNQHNLGYPIMVGGEDRRR